MEGNEKIMNIMMKEQRSHVMKSVGRGENCFRKKAGQMAVSTRRRHDIQRQRIVRKP